MYFDLQVGKKKKQVEEQEEDSDEEAYTPAKRTVSNQNLFFYLFDYCLNFICLKRAPSPIEEKDEEDSEEEIEKPVKKTNKTVIQLIQLSYFS